MEWPDKYIEKPDELLAWESTIELEDSYGTLDKTRIREDAERLIEWLIASYSFKSGQVMGLELKIQEKVRYNVELKKENIRLKKSLDDVNEIIESVMEDL